MGKYFGTDGFRGEANVDLTSEHAYKIGKFIGWYYGARKGRKARIVIGKDTRRSSYMFEYALVAGLTSTGADAVSYTHLEGLWDLTGYREGLEEGIKTLERHLDDSRCEYAWLAMRIALEKLNWVNELRPAYLRGDKAVVLTMANEKLPAMRELYVKMMSVWREQWESGRKRNGWETICARLGAVIARLDDVQRILLRWADGTIECVEELDETPLPASRLCGRQD